MHIWLSRRFTKRPNFDVFKERVDIKYQTEKYIASQNNTEKKFQAKWQVFINNRSKVYTPNCNNVVIEKKQNAKSQIGIN